MPRGTPRTVLVLDFCRGPAPWPSAGARGRTSRQAPGAACQAEESPLPGCPGVSMDTERYGPVWIGLHTRAAAGTCSARSRASTKRPMLWAPRWVHAMLQYTVCLGPPVRMLQPPPPPELWGCAPPGEGAPMQERTRGGSALTDRLPVLCCVCRYKWLSPYRLSSPAHAPAGGSGASLTSGGWAGAPGADRLGAVCPVGLPGGGRARVESGTAIPSRPERSLAQARTPDPPTRWGPTAVSPPARVAERRPRGGACLCSSGCPRAPGLRGGRDADFQVVRVAAVNGTRRLRDALACSQMGVAAQGVVGLIETSRHPMSPNVCV